MSRKRGGDRDVFDLFAPPPAPSVDLTDLALAVQGLPGGAMDFRTAPDLTEVAVAVQRLLEATGNHAAAVVAQRWVYYETSGRQSSRMEEARARADALYRLDLGTDWKPVQQFTQSVLPWRQPETEVISQSAGGASNLGHSES